MQTTIPRGPPGCKWVKYTVSPRDIGSSLYY